MVRDHLQDHWNQVDPVVQMVLFVLGYPLFLMDPLVQVVQMDQYRPLSLLLLAALMVQMVQEVPHHPAHQTIH
jgi:hypothetical protein